AAGDVTALAALAPPHEPYWFVSVVPPAAYRLTDPPRFITPLAEGTWPRDAGVDDAPGELAAGIELAPLADIPPPALGEGAVPGPLAENGLGLLGGIVGVTVGRRAA